MDTKVYFGCTKQKLDQYASSKYPLQPGNPYVTKNSLDHNVFDQKNLGAQLQFHKAVANHHLAWGAEYEHNDNERSRYKRQTKPNDFVGYNELSFPATTSERGALCADDARYEYYHRMIPDNDLACTGELLHKFSEGEISPKLGLVFKEPMYERPFSSLNHQAYGYRIEPNSNLNPESRYGIDLGVRGSHNSLSYEAASLYNKFDDFIEMV